MSQKLVHFALTFPPFLKAAIHMILNNFLSDNYLFFLICKMLVVEYFVILPSASSTPWDDDQLLGRSGKPMLSHLPTHITLLCRLCAPQLHSFAPALCALLHTTPLLKPLLLSCMLSCCFEFAFHDALCKVYVCCAEGIFLHFTRCICGLHSFANIPTILCVF